MGTGSVKTLMPPVTPQAEKRLILFQEIIGNGAVHIMAEVTILLDRGMLIEKWPLLVRMALVAQVIDRDGVQAMFLGSMGAVAGAALHPAFPHWVMGGKFRQHLHLLMTIIAERRLSLV